MYTKQYFIEKFSNIPDEMWTEGMYADKEGRRCALGWCGMTGHFQSQTEESAELNKVFGKIRGITWQISDGHDPRFQQPTPKARILAALESIEE